MWAVVSLLTQVAESIVNVFGSILVKREAMVSLLNFCLFIKLYEIPPSRAFRDSSERVFYIYSLRLCAAAMLPQKPAPSICCQGQTQVLLRLYKNICCLTLPCKQPVICTDTCTHTSSPNDTTHRRNPEYWNFCDIPQLLLAVEKTTCLLQTS